MSDTFKEQKKILEKLNIDRLTPMQEETAEAIHSGGDVVLISPTGTGKTLAYLLPLIAGMDAECEEVQLLIVVPSRELAIQIEQVTRELGSGYKTNAVYGGRSFQKDRLELKHRPAILIGTPGRVADHIRRNSFSTEFIDTLVLDEFDKSLAVGFEADMKDICASLWKSNKRILTSATPRVHLPEFVALKNPVFLNFEPDGEGQLTVKTVVSPSRDKLETLVALLCHLGSEPGIIFCNFKETIQRVSDYLTEHHIGHGCFQGGMEQVDRERVLIRFRNGTHRILVATDLAARGLDVPEIKWIIHYQLPPKSHEFLHRNGRTARMLRDGTAYVLRWEQESLPGFVESAGVEELREAPVPPPSPWCTLFVSGGRKDKISKGDIAGLFIKEGGLLSEQVGPIELKPDCCFVAVPVSESVRLVSLFDNARLKGRKLRVSVI